MTTEGLELNSAYQNTWWKSRASVASLGMWILGGLLRGWLWTKAIPKPFAVGAPWVFGIFFRSWQAL